MTDNPYEIASDDLTYAVNFSGGRSSAFMLHQILEANSGLPDNAIIVFANTGKEKVQTIDFVNEIQTRWQIKIHWLEYDFDADAKGGRYDSKHIHRVVDHKFCALDGEPFETLNRYKKYLPNPVTRIRTSELKVNTVDRFLRRDRNVKKQNIRNILGIRYDERDRWEEAIMKHCHTLYPMVYAEHTKTDVLKFWDSQTFDLALDRNSVQGNCDLCFMKGRKSLEWLIQQNPSLADWWIAQEKFISIHRSKTKKESSKQFSKRYSYQDLLDYVNTQPSIPFDFEPIAINCFCGD